MLSKIYYVYMLASKRNGTLYIGFTDDLKKRVYQHKMDLADSFTKRYKVHLLVYFEQYGDPQEGIKREKILKRWKRIWKLQLIEKNNTIWQDLYNQI